MRPTLGSIRLGVCGLVLMIGLMACAPPPAGHPDPAEGRAAGARAADGRVRNSELTPVLVEIEVLPTGDEAEEILETYLVNGLERRQLVRNLFAAAQRSGMAPGVVGRLDPRFEYSYEYRTSPAAVEITKFTIDATSTIRIPEWVDRPFADEALRRQWDDVEAWVLAHEEQHRRIFYDHLREFGDLVASIGTVASAEELRARVTAVHAEVFERHERAQQAFHSLEKSWQRRFALFAE